mmetsp:Transcript_33799/g.66926  ORF Transcript_33799/g.66926 Transcript_33799/m.66926 type:complete len:401 (+) Transcript_33799:2-1204(+)
MSSSSLTYQGPLKSAARLTSHYNGVFFLIFQFAGTAGLVMATVLMKYVSSEEQGHASDPDKWKLKFFGIYGGIAAFSLFLFACVRENVHKLSVSMHNMPVALTAKQTFLLFRKDKRMAMLIPLLFVNGWVLGFFTGDVGVFVSRTLGDEWVGAVGAAFYATNSAASWLYGFLIFKNCAGRFSVLLFASVVQIIALLSLCLIAFPENFRWEDASSSWEEVRKPETWEFVTFFGLVALLALGDSAYESQEVAVLQNFFQTENEQKGLAAVANVKVWQSLGFAMQFALSLSLQLGMPGDLDLRRLILGCVLTAGLVWVTFSLSCLHWRVASLDGRREGETNHHSGGDRVSSDERETLQASQDSAVTRPPDETVPITAGSKRDVKGKGASGAEELEQGEIVVQP